MGTLAVIAALPWTVLVGIAGVPVRFVRKTLRNRPRVALSVGALQWRMNHPVTDDTLLGLVAVRLGVGNASSAPNGLTSVRMEFGGHSPLYPAMVTSRDARHDHLVSGNGSIFTGIERRDMWLDLPVNLPPRQAVAGWVVFVTDSDGISVRDLRHGKPRIVAQLATGGSASVELEPPALSPVSNSTSRN